MGDCQRARCQRPENELWDDCFWDSTGSVALALLGFILQPSEAIICEHFHSESLYM